MFRIDRSVKKDDVFFKMIPKEEHFTSKVLPLILRNHISDALCSEFISKNKDREWYGSISPNGENNKEVITYDHRDSDSMRSNLVKWTGIEKEFNLDVLAPYFNDYWGKNFKYRGIDNFKIPQFTRFKEGHYCNAHLDVIYKPDGGLFRSSRRLTAILYLNDWTYARNVPGCFSGGELCFPSVIDDYLGQCLSIQPKAGDIVIFPTTPDYFHSVPVVTSGTRYTLLYFIELDQ